MKILGVIPARYNSSRFPGKPLAQINGIAMIIHVARIVERALGKQNVLVATDDQRIYSYIENFGYQVVMTSDQCLTGTDRLAEVSKKVVADIYLNIQGDEPMIDPADILLVLEAKKNNPERVVNGMCEIKNHEDPYSLNLPKLVVDCQNRLLYMSRMAIPGSKDSMNISYKKQVCIYAFNKDELDLFSAQSEKSINEKFEDIEILRFVDLGYPVQMVEVSDNSVAVDTPEDLQKVITLMKKQK